MENNKIKISSMELIYQCDKYCSIAQKQEVENFLNLIIKKEFIIYRGDNYSELQERYRSNDDSIDFEEKLFMLGNKAKAYWSENRTNENKINNKNEKFIGNIFQYFNNYLKSFEDKNLNNEFKDYFSKNSNKEIFISNIIKLDQKERLKVRDYYLFLLHQIEVKPFNKNSFCLSTSRKFEVAEECGNGIIFVGWIPFDDKFYVNFEEVKKVVEGNKLPTSEKPHPKEKERTLKGGLLPHFLLGYILTEEKKFIVNPNFFIKNDDKEKIANNGMVINQTDFDKVIKNTNLGAGYWVLNSNNAEDKEY